MPRPAAEVRPQVSMAIPSARLQCVEPIRNIDGLIDAIDLMSVSSASAKLSGCQAVPSCESGNMPR